MLIIREGLGADEMGDGYKTVQTCSYNKKKSWGVMYSIENIFNNNVITLNGDR